jgi:DNA end-binding protein Ku
MASSVWKGHLTFGLVSFPVRLAVAARSETISFNQLHKSDNSRIKQVIYCQAEDKAVPRSELVKGFEYEKDKYVVVDEEEIRRFAPKTAKVMEILEFVKAEEVDPVYLESSYYLQPEEAGEKPYTLLFEAMKRSGYVSVAKLTMHNREHIVIVRPGKQGLLLHTMYYRDEIRAVDEFRTDASQVKDKELDLAMTLIQTLAASFEPEKYKDTYRENIRALIDAKIQGAQIVEPPAAQTMAPVVDIMEALRASLDQLKKPVATAFEPARQVVVEMPAAEAAGEKRKRAPRRAGAAG